MKIQVINRKERTDLPKARRIWALDCYIGDFKIADIEFSAGKYILRAIRKSNKDDVAVLMVAGAFDSASAALQNFWDSVHFAPEVEA